MKTLVAMLILGTVLAGCAADRDPSLKMKTFTPGVTTDKTISQVLGTPAMKTKFLEDGTKEEIWVTHNPIWGQYERYGAVFSSDGVLIRNTEFASSNPIISATKHE